MRTMIRRTNTYLLAQKPAVPILMALFIAAVLGILDNITGFEITFSLFYLFPVAMATWYVDFRAGILVSILSISIWLVSNRLAGEIYSNEAIRYWNAAIRLSLFIAIAYLLNYLKKALEQERTLSRTDFLTGAINVREFYRLGNLEILRSQRYHHPLTVAYIDLDDFKKINDDCSHSSGDFLLKHVAQTITQCLRATDIVARLGGDEFAMLLPETDGPSARIVIQKIQNSLEDCSAAGFQQVSMSIGVVSYARPPETVDDLLNKADNLMYEVKRNGKNGVAYLFFDEG